MKFFVKCDECFNEFKLHGKISHTTRCPFCDKLFEVSISVKHDFEGELDRAKFIEELKNFKDTIYE